MDVQRRQNAVIYGLHSSSSALPEWVNSDRARRKYSQQNDSYRRRIELLQEFEFPASSSRLVQSWDGRYLLAAGTYPPRIKCYDTDQLGLKFERYVNGHITDLAMLGEDYGKLALLLDDRTIDLHAPYGNHESIRIPTFGRQMVYDQYHCDLLVAAKGCQVYRLNLEEGRFREPWKLNEQSAGGVSIALNQTYPLVAVGCDDGQVRFWDSRVADTASSSSSSSLQNSLSLNVRSAVENYGYGGSNHTNSLYEISSLAFEGGSGWMMAAGTSGGVVALYDVRSSKPVFVQEHKHGTAIHTVKFHQEHILSGDEQLIKIWKYKGNSKENSSMALDADESDRLGGVLANVEGSGKLSHFVVAGDESDPQGSQSGLLLCATDQPKMESYYIPSLGVAPKWCSFLENITEELEERDLSKTATTTTATNAGSDGGVVTQDGQESVFENYKFVSREEIEQLGISHLVGTPLLRGYMHGFFMDLNLYTKVRAVANPFEYEEYRKQKLKQRLEEQRASRIAPKGQTKKKKKNELGEVNQELAERLAQKASGTSKTTKAGIVATQVLEDDRFGNLFTNPDYQIDEEDANFKLRNPSGVGRTKPKDDMDSDDDDDDVGDEQGDNAQHIDEDGPISGFNRYDDNDDVDESDNDDDDSDDGFAGGKVRGEMYREMKKEKTAMSKKKKLQKKNRKAKPVMYEAEDFAGDDVVNMGLGDASASSRLNDKSKIQRMSLADRLQKAKEEETVGESITTFVKGQGAVREFTYVPKDRRGPTKGGTKGNAEDEGRKRKRSRRGIKDLGFKTPFKHHSK